MNEREVRTIGRTPKTREELRCFLGRIGIAGALLIADAACSDRNGETLTGESSTESSDRSVKYSKNPDDSHATGGDIGSPDPDFETEDTGSSDSGLNTGAYGETAGSATDTDGDTNTVSDDDTDSNGDSDSDTGTETISPLDVWLIRVDCSSTDVCLEGGNIYPLTFNTANATSFTTSVEVIEGNGTPGSINPPNGSISGDGTIELDYTTGNIVSNGSDSDAGGEMIVRIEITVYDEFGGKKTGSLGVLLR